MRVVELIERKRDGKLLSHDEIVQLIADYTAGNVPDYQMSALMMAIVLQGMTPDETTALTYAIAQSGEMLDLSDIAPFVVDKHSTGGVGDKTSLVATPLVAACGVPVGKMSGRGLGFSGGTLDKLESFPGFGSDLSVDQFRRQLRQTGLVLAGASVNLAPADGMLYALRDVTGTVKSIPLIASSIMSKKIAAGAQAIVLDVKLGNGAFMSNIEDARELAEMMVAIGKSMNRKVVCLLSDMNQPLGRAVGNAIEVKEALETLQGGGPPDFREHCLHVADYLLLLAGKADSLAAARELGVATLDNGRALAKFRELVTAQGGDASYIDRPEKLPKAALCQTITAPHSGYVHHMLARPIGQASVMLGAGRATKSDTIDLAVGLYVHAKVGDQVQAGDPLITLYANDESRLADALEMAATAFEVAPQPCEPLPLFYGVVE